MACLISFYNLVSFLPSSLGTEKFSLSPKYKLSGMLSVNLRSILQPVSLTLWTGPEETMSHFKSCLPFVSRAPWPSPGVATCRLLTVLTAPQDGCLVSPEPVSAQGGLQRVCAARLWAQLSICSLTHSTHSLKKITMYSNPKNVCA